MQKLKQQYPFLFFILIALWQFPLSPFYKFSLFPDTNTMLSMGKSLAHGVVPFKDIFEQRGLYMYVIHMVGVLPQAIHWLWFIEMINFYFIYLIVVKIFQLKDTIKHPEWWSVISLIILQFATGINQGASPEEFMLLPNTYAIYVILKHKNGLQNMTNHERFWLGLGLAYIFNVKYSNIGIIGIILLFDVILNHKKIWTVLLWDAYGFILGWLPVLLYFGFNNYLIQFFNVYFLENSQSTATNDVMSFMSRYAVIIGSNILMTLTSILLFWFAMRCGLKTYTRHIRYLVYSAFFIELLCISLIMRIGSSYTLSLQWMIILIGCYGLKDLKISFTTTRWKPINLFLLTFTMGFTIGINGYHLFTGDFSNIFALRIISPLQYKTLNNENVGDIKQSKIIAKNGNGSVLSYGYITNNIYLYNKSYPTKNIRYFDQTTIPYKTQPQAADSQYKYIENAVPKWVSMNLPSVEQSQIKHYAKKQSRLKSQLVASITAYTDRAIAHKNEYQLIRIKSNGLYSVYYFPKVLFKNYVAIDISNNQDYTLNNETYTTMNILFIRKSDVHKYPDLKQHHLVDITNK